MGLRGCAVAHVICGDLDLEKIGTRPCLAISESAHIQAQKQHQAREIYSSALRGSARPSHPVGLPAPSCHCHLPPNGIGPSGSGSNRPLTPAEMLVQDIDEVMKKRILD